MKCNVPEAPGRVKFPNLKPQELHTKHSEADPNNVKEQLMTRIAACLSTAIITLALAAVTARAQNQAQFNERLSAVVQAVSDVTDPGFAKDIRFFTSKYAIDHFPQIPPDFAMDFGPELPDKTLESTPEAIAFASAYFPMNKGMRLKYEYTSSEFDDAKIVVIEIIEVSAKNEEVYAKVRMTPNLGGRTASSFYTITKTPMEVFSGETIIMGPRKEFPIPLKVGRRWTESSNLNRVSSLKSKVKISVPAGDFTGCLRIVTKIDGGDGGSAVRFYYPGVGLVYEEYMGEERQDTIRLLSL